MRILSVVVTIGLLGFAEFGEADNSATVDQLLGGLTSIAASKCQNRGVLVRDFEAQGKTAEARSVRLAETMICECMPAQVQSLRTSLKPEELQQHVTESEFQVRYSPKIINKCAGNQLRETYGKGCDVQFKKFRKNSAAYCQCMQSSLSQLTDDEVAKIGKESSEYTPLAANAKARGLPMPEQPTGIKRLAGMDAACASK